ncbi:hypothetical protein ACLMJK_004502 [Lecanora helva]
MAASPNSITFDDIIQAGRQQREKQKLAEDMLGQGRREKQRLADEVLGKGRRSITQNNGVRTTAVGGSLASRVGIAKPSQRSASNTPKPKPDFAATFGQGLPQPRVSRPARENPIARQVKNDLLFEAATSQSPRNGNVPRRPGEEISIRGTAGPYVVIGSNFAPGTTAADIESAMVPSGGEMQSCKILTSTPTVIAEMVFSEKQNAESVISTFNNKKADGRILHIYMKTGDPSTGPAITPTSKIPTQPKETSIDLSSRNNKPVSYDAQREHFDRQRRADPEVQDGSFGFGPKEGEIDVDMEVLGVEKPATSSTQADYDRSHEVRRDNRDRERRDDRRDSRYGARPNGGRGRAYFDRDRESGRPRNDYRLHSDDLYPRPRGRGFR